jgi:hypothetical protein
MIHRDVEESDLDMYQHGLGRFNCESTPIELQLTPWWYKLSCQQENCLDDLQRCSRESIADGRQAYALDRDS